MSSRARVSAYRDRLRSEGLRPVQVWVPDVRSAASTAEAQRQATLVAAASAESEDMQFVEAISTAWDE